MLRNPSRTIPGVAIILYLLTYLFGRDTDNSAAISSCGRLWNDFNFNKCDQAIKYASRSNDPNSWNLIDIEIKKNSDEDQKAFFRSRVYRAIKDNDLENLRFLHKKIPDILKTSKGFLTYAVTSIPTMEFLLDNGYSVDSYDHTSALDVAVSNNLDASVNFLLDRGAKYDGSIIFRAIAQNNVELTKKLLALNPDLFKNHLTSPKNWDNKQSILTDIFKNGCAEMLRILLDTGYPIEGFHEDGALMNLAILFNQPQLSQLLIQRGAQTPLGSTALTWAVQNGYCNDKYFNEFTTLFEQNPPSAQTNTELMVVTAIANRSPQLLRFLLNKGLSIPPYLDLAIELPKRATKLITKRNVGVINDPDQRMFCSLLEIAAERKDFADIVAQFSIDYTQFQLEDDRPNYADFRRDHQVKSLALLVNAGYQLRLDKNTIHEQFLLQLLDEIKQLKELPAKHCKVKPRLQGIQAVLSYAAQQGHFLVVNKILITTPLDNATLVKAACLAKKAGQHQVSSRLYTQLCKQLPWNRRFTRQFDQCPANLPPSTHDEEHIQCPAPRSRA